MATILSILVSGLVQWIIIPLIMLALSVFAWFIANSAKDYEKKASAWAGFLAGLVVFVIYVVSQLSNITGPDFNLSTLRGFLILPMGFGLVSGFVFLWLVKFLIPTRLVGLITLLLSAASALSLFNYFFINNLRVSVLYWILGTALGILLHIILFPTSVRDIFN